MASSQRPQLNRVPAPRPILRLLRALAHTDAPIDSTKYTASATTRSRHTVEDPEEAPVSAAACVMPCMSIPCAEPIPSMDSMPAISWLCAVLAVFSMPGMCAMEEWPRASTGPDDVLVMASVMITMPALPMMRCTQ